MTDSATDLDAAFAAVAERRERDAADRDAARQMWLSHHWPHRHERCATIAGRPVCRRCSWLYPIAAIVGLAVGTGALDWPATWDPIAVWLLALPATVEFVAGELFGTRYNPRRQIAVTIPLAIGVGRGAAAELAAWGSWLWWGPALVYGTIWFAVGVIAWRTNRGQYV